MARRAEARQAAEREAVTTSEVILTYLVLPMAIAIIFGVAVGCFAWLSTREPS